MKHIDFEQLKRLPDAEERFARAVPYEHLIVDNFLHASSFRAVLDAIPAPDETSKSSDYIFAKNKFENPKFDSAKAVLLELKSELESPEFADFLSRVAGKRVFVDPAFVGGGLHQGGRGSFLDMHADFSRHPVHREWVRELNILLYLNDPYDEVWGGHLEMENRRNGLRGSVSPRGNRLLIMRTKEYTLHGYKAINFPPGRYRTSIASYAYYADHDFAEVPDRSTLWVPRDSGVGKRVIARIMPTIVRFKRSLFGSSTAKRALRDKQ